MDIVSHVGEYLETRVELMKLRAIDKVSRLLAWLMAALILFFALTCMVLFLSLAAAHAIGDALGKPWLGYLIVAGVYALLGCFAWFGRERFFRRPLVNAIISQLDKDDNSDKHEKTNESGNTREKD